MFQMTLGLKAHNSVILLQENKTSREDRGCDGEGPAGFDGGQAPGCPTPLATEPSDGEAPALAPPPVPFLSSQCQNSPLMSRHRALDCKSGTGILFLPPKSLRDLGPHFLICKMKGLH